MYPSKRARHSTNSINLDTLRLYGRFRRTFQTPHLALSISLQSLGSISASPSRIFHSHRVSANHQIPFAATTVRRILVLQTRDYKASLTRLQGNHTIPYDHQEHRVFDQHGTRRIRHNRHCQAPATKEINIQRPWNVFVSGGDGARGFSLHGIPYF